MTARPRTTVWRCSRDCGRWLARAWTDDDGTIWLETPERKQRARAGGVSFAFRATLRCPKHGVLEVRDEDILRAHAGPRRKVLVEPLPSPGVRSFAYKDRQIIDEFLYGK